MTAHKVKSDISKDAGIKYIFLSTYMCASLCTSLTTRTNFQLNQTKYRLCIQVFLSCPAFRIEILTQNLSPFDGQSFLSVTRLKPHSY